MFYKEKYKQLAHNFLSEDFKKLPLKAPKPAVKAPIKAVAKISTQKLSIFKSTIDIFCASACPFALLIKKLNAPHNIKSAVKPAKKLLAGACFITAATIHAAIAMLHQGKKRHAAKLSKAVNKTAVKNFIVNIILII